jgi:putative ABC transport system substrate-binding protein
VDLSEHTEKGREMKRVGLGLLTGILICALAVAVIAEPLKIGITKIVEHPALDAVQQGVIDGLTAAGYVEGVDIEYIVESAQGDLSLAASIPQDFQARGVDLVVAIATATAKAAVQVLEGTGIPVVYSAITNPLGEGLIVSAEDPSLNGNVTGVSDMIDVENDLRLLKALGPEIQRIGLIYNAGEPNAEYLKDETVAAAPGVGLEIVLATASVSSEVQMAAQSLVGRVDAFFVTTDNTVVSALDAVVAVAEEAGIPFLVADPTSLPYGPAIAAGFDYYALGRATSTICAEILAGTSASEISPVLYSDVEPEEVWLNLDAAAKIGLSLSSELIDMADGIYYNGTMWERSS